MIPPGYQTSLTCTTYGHPVTDVVLVLGVSSVVAGGVEADPEIPAPKAPRVARGRTGRPGSPPCAEVSH